MNTGTHSNRPAPHARRGSSWASGELQPRNYGHVAMVAAAASRALVTLPDGRTARLIYWPIPADQRRPGRAASGGRAKVKLPGGAIISVPTDGITLIGHESGEAA